MKHIKKIFIIIATWWLSSSFIFAHVPRVTIVVVIEQLPAYIFSAICPHFKGGIHHLLQCGINYKQAYYPYAAPEKAPGYAALNTGTYASRHGIISNSWIDTQGRRIYADDDTSGNAQLFGDKEDAVGKSTTNLQVDGISDQAILNPIPGHINKVFALSLTSEGAIMCAGHLGKAIWFDAQQGAFTSSKAYFDELPCWLTAFNREHILAKDKNISWKLQYSRTSDAYALGSEDTKKTAKSRAGQTILAYENGSYESFVKTPHATKILFDLARTCINEHLSCDRDDKLIVWISLSSTALIGNEFGNKSIEYIDSLYHIDCQLKKFMHFMQRTTKGCDIAWILTSDHGSMPAVEHLKERGYEKAQCIDTTQLQKTINESINKKFGIADLIGFIDTPNIYFDLNKVHNLDAKKASSIMHDTIHLLSKTPGIRNMWTYDQLQKLSVNEYSIEQFYKEQSYPGRSGQLLLLLEPYSQLTKDSNGITHGSPYNYDRHVPLIVYQKGALEHKTVNETVLMTQVAPTISNIMGIPKPSACFFNFLPGAVCHEIIYN